MPDTGNVFAREQLRPSILDRLLDDDPETTREPVWQQAAVLESVRDTVCRDLQNLLNSRRCLEELPENFPELHSSLLNYGLPDLQSLEIREGRAGQQIAHLIEEVIRDFEPRLRGVRVRSKGLDNHASDSLRQLSFEIDAVLVIEPLKEPVLFTSSFNSISGEFNVEGG